MTRREADRARVRRFMERLGQEARGPGIVYFTGGACAVLIGWRAMTVDVDLRFDPEPEGAFEALPKLKEELELNVELASPQDFIPAVDGWTERSPWIGEFGKLLFRHYDFVSQALAKIERGHTRDLADVRAMFERELVDASALRGAFEQIEPRLYRYPAIDPGSFRRRVESMLAEERS